MAKTDRLVIRITPELKSQLQAAAEADGRSVSNYIEKLIKEAMRYSAEPAPAKTINPSGSEFLKAVGNVAQDSALEVMDELVEAVKILHPRMYTTFIDKVQDL